MANNVAASTDPIKWGDDELILLDQRRLPHEVCYVHCGEAGAVRQAIVDMVVRGAPAIGVSAAYGVVLAARAAYAAAGADWRDAIRADLEALRASRPTAVNLMWAVDAMAAAFGDISGDPYPPLLAQAQAIHARDVAANKAIGAFGAELIGARTGVLTHCNAGALATAGYGTALGVIRSGHSAGLIAEVFATETRPWLQGARLTAWELLQDGIDVTLIADSAAAHLMQLGRVQWVVTGADRIAANGDTANKIGTYAPATLARAHGVRFMVAAPLSTIDLATPSGAEIPLEHRDASELKRLGGQLITVPEVRAFNPVFDITPAALIDVLVTEKGVVLAPDRERIADLFEA